MSDKTTIATRMKENYENRSKQFLTRRTPTIIRLDGKAFHTYTKGLDKPFDEGLMEDMQLTTAFLCKEIQGVKCGYTQSDEISLLLVDYDKLTSNAWFDYNVQKMVSVAASLATAKFNELRYTRSALKGDPIKSYHFKHIILAYFDARVFQISDKEEVVNYFLWRQQDAEKNSVAMLAQSLYSHGELHKKHGGDMQEMCFQKGHNWNDLSSQKKRGSFVVKQTYVNNVNTEKRNKFGNKLVCYFSDTEKYAIFDEDIKEWVDKENSTIRTKWEMLEETPYFGRNRESIKKYL